MENLGVSADFALRNMQRVIDALRSDPINDTVIVGGGMQMVVIRAGSESTVDVFRNANGGVSLSVRTSGVGHNDWRMVNAEVDIDREGVNDLINSLTPIDSAVVDRARFERIRQVASIAVDEGTWEAQEGYPNPTFVDAASRLQPGDLDPLP